VKENKLPDSRRCIYPGSFDPVTNGHLNIICRSLKIFDKVTVAIAINARKKPLFSMKERVSQIKTVLKDALSAEDFSRVDVDSFEGLLVTYAEKKGACAIVRGLRAVSDFEYEFQMTSMNHKLNPQIETIFMMTDENNFYISSQTVKEVAALGGSVEEFVPRHVKEKLQKKYPALSGVGKK